MITSLLFLLAFGATLTALVWSGWQLFSAPQEDPLEDRLGELRAFHPAGAGAILHKRRGGGGFWNNLVFLVSRLGGEDHVEEVEKMLRTAGVRKREAAGYYLLFQICFFLALVGGALYLQWDADIIKKVTALIAPALLGYLLPKQILYRLAKSYKAKLQAALPDAVDLLGIVLSTGMSLDQAMLRVSEELQFIHPELANEFYTVVMQVKAGQERSKAFQQLVRRTGIDDIKSLAAMILQSERFGTSLSQALKVYAEGLRTSRRFRAEKAIAQAGIKMLFPIVIFILPVLFAITLGPGLISTLDSLRGGIGQQR